MAEFVTKTHKKKRKKVNKKEIWKKFASIQENVTPLECVYANSSKEYTQKEQERTECECCGGQLIIGEDGFLVCNNKTCGIIYKDKLDSSAEWRYYSGDGGQTGDPTRAGPPINELLRESSLDAEFCALDHLHMKCEKSEDILNGNLCHIKKKLYMMSFNELGSW